MKGAADALDAFADHFDTMLADLTPAKRKAVARKIGQRLRRSNTRRIAANVQPDGSAMEPRQDRSKRKKGKMFRNLRYARNFKVDADPHGVEVGFKRYEGLARIHHFGLVSAVGRNKHTGETIRARYPKRRLLGFGEDDLDAITDEVLEWLTPD